MWGKLCCEVFMAQECKSEEGVELVGEIVALKKLSSIRRVSGYGAALPRHLENSVLDVGAIAKDQ